MRTAILKKATLFFLLVGPSWLIYANTLDTPFYFDGHRNIEKNEHIRITDLCADQLLNAVFESPLPRRPLANISFALNYYVHGNKVLGYHVVNILIHTINGILIYLLVANTLSCPYAGVKRTHGGYIALFAALIWLVHPIQSTSVTYIVQRMNSMATLFYLSAMLFFVKGRLSTEGIGRWVWLSGSLVSGILALGSKEIAATLPVFIFLYEWYFLRDLDWTWLKRRVPHLIASTGLILLLVFLYLGADPLERILSAYAHRSFTMTERLLTQFRVILFYVSLLAYPHPSRLTFLHDLQLSHSLAAPVATLFSISSIAGLLMLAVATARRHRLMSFSILFFLGNLVIESSVLGLEMVFEHRTYLPSLGFAVVLALSLQRVIRSGRRYAPAIAALVFVVLSVATYQRNETWRSPALLLENAMKRYPRNARIASNLADVYLREGNYAKALRKAEWAVALNPNLIAAQMNLGVALARQELFEKAIAQYLKVLELDGGFAGAHYNLGNAWMELGNPSKAIHHYRKALELDPKDPDTYNNLGIALARQGKISEAMDCFRKAVAIRPEFRPARNNLEDCLQTHRNG